MSHWTKCVKTAVLAAATFAIVGTATPALAQGAQPADKLIDKISFGYKFYRVSQSEYSVNYPLGVYFDVDGKIKNKDLKWMAEVTWARHAESFSDGEFSEDYSAKILFFGAGIKREWAKDPKLIKHAQALIGLVHAYESYNGGGYDDSYSDNSLAFKVSGGVDKYLTDKWDARFGAGFIHVFSDPGANIIRFFVGVVKKSN